MAKGYIAGPMRNIPLLNFPAFDRAAHRGRHFGHTIISPADMDRASGVKEAEVVAAETTNAMIREFVFRDTTAILSLRAEDGDFLALLPNWFKSTGATAEVFLARWLKLAFLDAETFEPWPLMPDGVPMPVSTRALHATRRMDSCSLGDGMCGESHDLATRSTIAIAEDFANRKEI